MTSVSSVLTFDIEPLTFQFIFIGVTVFLAEPLLGALTEKAFSLDAKRELRKKGGTDYSRWWGGPRMLTSIFESFLLAKATRIFSIRTNCLVILTRLLLLVGLVMTNFGIEGVPESSERSVTMSKFDIDGKADDALSVKSLACVRSIEDGWELRKFELTSEVSCLDDIYSSYREVQTEGESCKPACTSKSIHCLSVCKNGLICGFGLSSGKAGSSRNCAKVEVSGLSYENIVKRFVDEWASQQLDSGPAILNGVLRFSSIQTTSREKTGRDITSVNVTFMVGTACMVLALLGSFVLVVALFDRKVGVIDPSDPGEIVALWLSQKMEDGAYVKATTQADLSIVEVSEMEQLYYTATPVANRKSDNEHSAEDPAE